MSSTPDLPDYVLENRSHWDATADAWVDPAIRSWVAQEPTWGSWGLPEQKLQLLPIDMSGMTAIELGCGTAYVSAWMAKRGAQVVGIDNSERQLATARRLSAEHGIEIELIHGNAETVPYPDSSFDFAISEYGAAIWCDPYRWIPEAFRLLRPGGRLVFLGTSPLVQLCMPLSGASAEPHLHRSYFAMHRIDWTTVEIDPGGIEFNLPISEWFRLFADTGFEVTEYLELQAPESAEGTPFAIPASWAKRWPSEQVWKLRNRTYE